MNEEYEINVLSKRVADLTQTIEELNGKIEVLRDDTRQGMINVDKNIRDLRSSIDSIERKIRS